jgi:hypothetical protein
MMTNMKKGKGNIMGVAYATSGTAMAERIVGFVRSQREEGKEVEINAFANAFSRGVEIVGLSKDPTKSMNGGEYEESFTIFEDGSFQYGSSAEFAFCPYTGEYNKCDDGPMHSDHYIGVTL